MTTDHEGTGKRLHRLTDAPPSAVWSVLADGWQYPIWVVGASRIREVEPHWPTTGSRIHHSIGVWPMVFDDQTLVTESHPERLLVLQARGWPLGEARVRIGLRAVGARTEVSITEDVTHGPARLLPEVLRQLTIVPRNVETLQRLVLLAEGRHRQAG